MHLDEIPEFLLRRGGAARAGEIPATKYQLRLLVDRGVLNHSGRGCYSLPGARRDIVLAVEHDAVISCRSALRTAGFDISGDPAVIHFSVPRRRGTRHRLPPSSCRHYEDLVPGRHRVATVRDAAARAATCGPYDSSVAALDRVVQGCDPSLLEDILARARRSSPSRAAALQRDVSFSSRSSIETQVRLALRRVGLATVAGVQLPGVGEVDFLVEGLVIVELDGFTFHADRTTFRSDRRRDRAALRLGFPTLRFAFEDSTPEAVIPDLVRQLEAMDGKPFPYAPSVGSGLRTAVEEIRRDCLTDGTRLSGWHQLTGRDRERALLQVSALQELAAEASRSTVATSATTVDAGPVSLALGGSPL